MQPTEPIPIEVSVTPTTKSRAGAAFVTFCLVGGIIIGFGLFFRQCSETASVQKTRTKEKRAYQDTTIRLIRLVLRKSDTIARLTRIVTAGELKAATAQEDIRKAVAQKNQAIAAMSEARQKIEALKVAFKNGEISADRLRDSLSSMPVFTDVQANRIYLQVVAERDLWRDSTKAVYAELGKKQAQVSGLENELNGTRIVITDTRQLVQDERAKASRGLIRKVLNGPRIRVLGKVDRKLSELQKKP